MTYSGYEIWTKLRENSWATQPLVKSADDSMKLRDGHAELSTSLARAQGGMANFWQGGAADAAASGLTPMIKASQDNSTYLSNAVQAMNAQSEHFLRVRDTVVDVSNDRPNDWDLASFNPLGASDSEKAAAKWDADTRHNVDTYEPYYQATQANNARMPVTYPDAHDPTVSVPPPEPTKPETCVEFPTGPASVGGGRNRADSGAPKQQSGTGSPGQQLQQQQVPAAAWQPPPPTNQPPPPQSNPFPSEGTTPGGFSPRPPGSGFGSGAGGFGPGSGGFSPGSGGFGPTGGTDFGAGGFGPLGGGAYSGGGSGSGVGGGLGGRGAGAAAGGGAAGELGQGKATGTGVPGKPGTGGYGGAAANSAAGAKGAAGMGGMGAGGAGKGQNAEDTEHERKIMLSGGDPDSVFGDNLPKATPPVIGA
jgi:hypothetical protein